MSAFLQVQNIYKDYGPVKVLRDITFDVTEGEGLAIIGPNGAGKTTLFRVLTGEAEANAGTVLFRGEDVTKLPASARVGLGFSRTFQVSRVFLELTALENLIAAIEARYRMERRATGQWYSWSPDRRVVAEAVERLADFGLADLRFNETRNLSHGDKKRLELAVALALEPHTLMLDEPTAGMSPPERQRTIELISRVKKERSLTMLLTEHEMDVVYGLASRILVMNYGELIAQGTAEEVRSNPLVQEVYLGKEITHAGGE